MPIMPVMLNGKVRLVSMPSGAGAKDLFDSEEENSRRYEVAKARQYVAGDQYDEENLATMESLGLDPLTQRLPEHLRLHAYSTQLGDSIGFLANQLAESFNVECVDPAVQAIVEGALRLSDQLTGTNDDADVSVVDVLEDALVAGDVAALVKWDPVEYLPYFEFWESEQVEFRYRDRSTLESVIREELVWVPGLDGQQQVLERVVYDLALREDGEEAWIEARKQTFWDDASEPESVEWLGLPVIPWQLLRAKQAGLRSTRGCSLVTSQAMQAADRYNANEQVAWLIARYNSHGNLAVVGDAAHLQLKKDDRLEKDIADVLTFPGGTQVTSIQLPTDTQMIEHQRSVLAESMYQTFGLTRVEPDTINTLGGVSGYALEILNRKSEGTFQRIRKNWVRDMKNLFVLAVEVHEARLKAVDTGDGVALGDTAPAWLVESDLFPDRRMAVTMGSGYIVDSVMTRDDFLAKLVSRREALRRRGLSVDEIESIEGELEDESSGGFEEGVFASSVVAGSTIGVVEVPDRGAL